MRPFLIDTGTETFMIAPFEQGHDLQNEPWGARETPEFDVSGSVFGGRSESIDPVKGSRLSDAD